MNSDRPLDDDRLPETATIAKHVAARTFFNTSRASDLFPLPRNPARLDRSSRGTFKIAQQGQILGLLTVGKNLSDLHARAAAFAQACPELSCRPLFFYRVDGWDYFGTEFFDGQNLEVDSDRRSVAATLAFVREIVSALQRTHRASSTAAASQELDRIFDRLHRSPLFGPLDQKILAEIVFPFVRDGALSAPAATRWTNRDLIARNVLVDAFDHVKLIDYEFAERTHFYAEDAWRWKTYSQLPMPARRLPLLDEELASKPWLEALAILRQIAEMNDINGPRRAAVDGSHHANRLREIVRAHRPIQRRILLPSPSFAPARPASEAVWTVAQLFWSSGGAFAEECSQRIEYAGGAFTLLKFDFPSAGGELRLRFDPADLPGSLEIAAFSIREPTTKQTLLSLDSHRIGQNLKPGRGLIDTPEAGAHFWSLDDDPQFAVITIHVAHPTLALTCEVQLRFSTEILALPILLPPEGETSFDADAAKTSETSE